MHLNDLPKRQKARILAVDWADIPPGEAHRLRSLGVEEDIEIQLLHRGILLWKDPLAVRVGRMTVALRRKVALAITVEPIAGQAEGQ